MTSRLAHLTIAGLVTAALVSAVSGCATSNSPGSDGQATTSSAAEPSTSQSESPSTPSSNTDKPSPTASSGPPSSSASRCGVDDLRVELRAVSSLSVVTGYFLLRNASSRPCWLSGFPSISGVEGNGTRTLGARSAFDGPLLPAPKTSGRVTLEPGQRAVVGVLGTAEGRDGASCPPPYTSFEIALKNSGPSQAVSAHFDDNAKPGDFPSCTGFRYWRILPSSALRQTLPADVR